MRLPYDLFQLSDELAVATRTTGHPRYDFPFRALLACRSVRDPAACPPVVFRVGALRDYGAAVGQLEALGFRVLLDEAAHSRASELPGWYPLVSELTPRSLWFSDTPPDPEEVGAELGWPVFVKGARQTHRHKASLSVAKNPAELARIFASWADDPVLHWQPLVCRAWCALQSLGSAVGDALPPAAEVRCFLWRGRLVGMGPYWPAPPLRLTDEQRESARRLAEEVARRLELPFLVVDLGLTVEGSWVLIECNDAQEASWTGVAPLGVWQRIAGACGA